MLVFERFCLDIWQLPQNLLGLLVVAFTRASKYSSRYDGEWHDFYVSRKFRRFGVSLGKYAVIGCDSVSEKTERHEAGHQAQSRMLGPLVSACSGNPVCGKECLGQGFPQKMGLVQERKVVLRFVS